jgi:hypothetical protein
MVVSSVISSSSRDWIPWSITSWRPPLAQLATRSSVTIMYWYPDAIGEGGSGSTATSCALDIRGAGVMACEGVADSRWVLGEGGFIELEGPV